MNTKPHSQMATTQKHKRAGRSRGWTSVATKRRAGGHTGSSSFTDLLLFATRSVTTVCSAALSLSAALVPLVSATLAVQVSGASYEAEVLADSPLVYYRLEETEGTAALNLGTLGAAAEGTYSDTTTDVLLGKESASTALGKAVRLDFGSIRVPDLGQGPLDQFSFEVWINRQSDPAPGAFFAIYAGDGFSGNTLHFNLKEPSATPIGPQIEFAIPAGGAHPQFFPMWPTNEWHQLVVTRDGATSAVRVYLDGRFVAEGTKGAGPEFLDGTIGAWGSTRNLDALIDEVAIYPAVLSEDRIAAHFNAAQLTLDPPEIIAQPVGATVFPGDHITLTAAVRGQALAYQWFKNSVAITGANSYSYTIDPVAAGDGGTYALQVSNTVQSVKTIDVVLTVSGGPKPINLISHLTFDSDTVANTTELRNAVAGRANGVFLQAPGFGRAAPTLSTADAKVGDAAMVLDGTTFLQLFDDAALNNLQAYTFAAWVKVDGFDDASGIASVFSYDGDAPPNGKLQIMAFVDGHLSVNTYGDGIFEAPTPTGWFHLAFTHDASPGVTNAVLYLNGTVAAQGTANLTGNLASGGTTLGSFGWASRRLIGSVDDVRFYDGALTADAVAALAPSGSAKLSVTRAGNQLTLSWTAAGFKLQQSADLGNPSNWTDVAGVGTGPVTVTAGTGNRFYRLLKP